LEAGFLLFFLFLLLLYKYYTILPCPYYFMENFASIKH